METIPETPEIQFARLIAQRNAACAVVILLTLVLVCACWALEVFPRRNAEVYRIENSSLRTQYFAMQKALRDANAGILETQAALVETRKALKQTEDALHNVEAAALHAPNKTRP
jgi:hypothetical protein